MTVCQTVYIIEYSHQYLDEGTAIIPILMMRLDIGR